jgi:hypothetical protein
LRRSRSLIFKGELTNISARNVKITDQQDEVARVVVKRS